MFTTINHIIIIKYYYCINNGTFYKIVINFNINNNYNAQKEKIQKAKDSKNKGKQKGPDHFKLLLKTIEMDMQPSSVGCQKITKEIIRFRTIGDLTITGAVESEASTLDHIIAEVAAARETERGNRADDQRSEAAMEERKKEGYF